MNKYRKIIYLTLEDLPEVLSWCSELHSPKHAVFVVFPGNIVRRMSRFDLYAD